MEESKTVKINVGGTVFSTSLAAITRLPGTYFSALLSGNWELRVGDGSIFIDRNPRVFPLILDYLQGKPLPAPSMLSDPDWKSLRDEADYYLLDELVQRVMPKFYFQCNPNFMALNPKRDAASVIQVLLPTRWGMVFASLPFTYAPCCRDKVYPKQNVRILAGKDMLIGLAPLSLSNIKSLAVDGSSVLGTALDGVDAFVMRTSSGFAYSPKVKGGKPYGRPVLPGSVVSVRAHADRSVSFCVDGICFGKAFTLPSSIDLPLFLVVVMANWSKGESSVSLVGNPRASHNCAGGGLNISEN